ncbi:D-aminoacyl-tRNA deacylase [Pediococcus acidilactici]|mgnify:FL=1|uniref:D-aminoacyl-tRNA deacylase n=1 Tax=Pediococcus acidilactici TaxID=1254 RepID=UPI000326F465|nr:D-aminoacyl-tRNA deacylase [Pediococcus acidilactici]EOA09425.1 D-tyrosyl-tRNA(Tyr) deacylase, dtd [Pediococcus acidilactici D3]MBW4796905.1 D-tyrosyl-tRNA(Tyr) deacylase [Pediococcus acidilactici]MBW9306157.1 D-tyrosyl-tRNA(Tyr) deacylase [Pediococcus acidilactici]MCE5961421.1 D-tyrosyl-tRNA(Tyr) deacylase [Pediococcus acidilactici]MCW8082352.1 D-aminoacyl-tRNA deacylase [Pediococcus acidilactici]
MRVVVQRVSRAQVTIAERSVGKINRGLMLLVAFNDQDTAADLDYVVRKITNLRIFENEEGKMDWSINEVGGAILSVSQFTLFASTKKGNRPSFTKSGNPETASRLYDEFNQRLAQTGIPVQTGEFGADMQVELVNDGPVTILLDTQNKE